MTTTATPHWLDIMPPLSVHAGSNDVIPLRDLRMRFEYDVVRIGWFNGHELIVKRDRVSERVIVSEAHFAEHYRFDLLSHVGFGCALRRGLRMSVNVQPKYIRDNIVARHMREETTHDDRQALAQALARWFV